jgi:4a-hydroxytetrahydrobiopterin dehydratase
MIASLFLLLIGAALAEYYEVRLESCQQLKSPTELFQNFLLPCGVFDSYNVTQACLSPEEESAALKTLPQWKLIPNTSTGDAIYRQFVFEDFRNAFLFMNYGAQLADKNGHHPLWSNLYNTVDVTLNTDDQACLSTFDIMLARGLDYANTLINPVA